MAQSLLAPELSYGRHFGPAPHNARQSAVLIALFQRDGLWRTTLTRRPTALKNHGGQICFPGGVVDVGESYWECAQREWAEELGEGRPWSLAGKLTEVYVFASNHVIHPHVALTEPPEYLVNAAEVADVIETPLRAFQFGSPLPRRTLQRWGTRFGAPCFTWEGEEIWGATAVVIAELAIRLRTVLPHLAAP